MSVRIGLCHTLSQQLLEHIKNGPNIELIIVPVVSDMRDQLQRLKPINRSLRCHARLGLGTRQAHEPSRTDSRTTD